MKNRYIIVLLLILGLNFPAYNYFVRYYTSPKAVALDKALAEKNPDSKKELTIEQLYFFFGGPFNYFLSPFFIIILSIILTIRIPSGFRKNSVRCEWHYF